MSPSEAIESRSASRKVPRNKLILLGLIEGFFVYLVFAKILSFSNIELPLAAADPLLIAAGLAICNTIIAMQVWSRPKTGQ